jgi:hypothetical protein
MARDVKCGVDFEYTAVGNPAVEPTSLYEIRSARRDVEPSLPEPIEKSVTHAPGTSRHNAAVSHSRVRASTDGGISASSLGLGRRTRSFTM